MKIQVLGSGCPTCKSLYKLVQKTVKQLGMDQEVEYFTDITKLVEEGIATSPALKVDGKVVCAGRMPTADEIYEFISSFSDNNNPVKHGCACGGSC